MKFFKITKNTVIIFISYINFFIANNAYSIKDNKITISVSRDGFKPWALETSGYSEVTFLNSILKPIVNISDKFYVKNNLLNVKYDFEKKGYIFKIPKGLKFSNGRDVEASDIEFSFARYFLTNKRAESKIFLSSIDGIKELKIGDKYVEGSVKGIKVIDKNKLIVYLKSQNPAFMYSLSCSWISVVPREELNEDYVTWKKFPIGAGDYKIKDVDNKNITTIVYTGKNRLEKDKPNTIVFDPTPESYKTADIVAYSNVNPNEKKYVIEKFDREIGNISIYFNYRNKLANNINFRNAVAYSINRENIFDKYNLHKISKSILTENLFNSRKNSRPYNPELAIKNINLVPKYLIKNTIKIGLGLNDSEVGDFDKRLINRIKENLLKIGLNVVFVHMNHLVFNDKDSDIVMKYDYRGNGLYDPLIFFNAFYKTSFLSNYFPRDEVTLNKYNKLLLNAANAGSDDIRAFSIANLEDFFYDNTIAIPLFGWDQYFWIRKDKIKTVGNFQSFSIDPSLIVTK